LALKEISALPTEELSNASRASKADRDLALIDYHGDIATAARIFEHFL